MPELKISCMIAMLDVGASDFRQPPPQMPPSGMRSVYDTRLSLPLDEDPDSHGRMPTKKGGIQVMHFTGLREVNDCLATSTDGHMSPPMVELLFLRRGGCMRQREKTLFVYLATLHYMSKVFAHLLSLP